MDHYNIDLETVPVGYRVFVVLCYAKTTGKCAVAMQPVELCCFRDLMHDIQQHKDCEICLGMSGKNYFMTFIRLSNGRQSYIYWITISVNKNLTKDS